MRHLKPNEHSSPKRFSKLVRICLITVAAVFILEIWMVNRLATYGDKIQQIKDTRASLQMENQYLESLVAQQSSLPVTEKKAAELGFAPIKHLAYLQTVSLAAAK